MWPGVGVARPIAFGPSGVAPEGVIIGVDVMEGVAEGVSSHRDRRFDALGVSEIASSEMRSTRGVSAQPEREPATSRSVFGVSSQRLRRWLPFAAGVSCPGVAA